MLWPKVALALERLSVNEVNATYSIKQPEFQRKDNTVGQLGISIQLFHILEPLEVQCQYMRQLLHSHPENKMYRFDLIRSSKRYIT